MFEDIQKLEKALTDLSVRQNKQRMNEILADEIARRCSIRIKADNRWQIRYHQGTPVPSEKAIQ